MPHPTPTAAPEAPPLPLRGEGLGVGGVALALAITLTTQAAAQVIPTGSPAADILLSQAIAEHRVFLTCSALDPATHAQILADWQRDAAAAVAILTANNTPPEAITAFTTTALPENLMPAPDTPWAEVTGLCATRPDWQTSYGRLDFTVLGQTLPLAFR
ncbi:hypothetical protein [Tabrizicola sp.]|uniref:hypothetical protein n=1 Tax=Tabrizicola sp. TaxID=2005166 RepID=UPI0025EE701F|nr:hypothetical protein [Tabrizicola sp.]MBY0350182.1 hypothetical protein [Tabrizicola sp.]MDK2775923.1 hypothetical protein [Tabrizicola sp.]